MRQKSPLLILLTIACALNAQDAFSVEQPDTEFRKTVMGRPPLPHSRRISVIETSPEDIYMKMSRAVIKKFTSDHKNAIMNIFPECSSLEQIVRKLIIAARKPKHSAVEITDNDEHVFFRLKYGDIGKGKRIALKTKNILAILFLGSAKTLNGFLASAVLGGDGDDTDSIGSFRSTVSFSSSLSGESDRSRSRTGTGLSDFDRPETPFAPAPTTGSGSEDALESPTGTARTIDFGGEAEKTGGKRALIQRIRASVSALSGPRSPSLSHSPEETLAPSRTSPPVGGGGNGGPGSGTHSAFSPKGRVHDAEGIRTPSPRASTPEGVELSPMGGSKDSAPASPSTPRGRSAPASAENYVPFATPDRESRGKGPSIDPKRPGDRVIAAAIEAAGSFEEEELESPEARLRAAEKLEAAAAKLRGEGGEKTSSAAPKGLPKDKANGLSQRLLTDKKSRKSGCC